MRKPSYRVGVWGRDGSRVFTDLEAGGLLDFLESKIAKSIEFLQVFLDFWGSQKSLFLERFLERFLDRFLD